jgi:nitric oxide reductase subunit B
MMGVFGMLGIGLMAFVLRETVSEKAWPSLEKLVGTAFWGLNIGLGMMVVLSLFPGGIIQVLDVIEHGYWHARSLAYTASPLARTLEWMRMPGDLVFIFGGAIPFAVAVVLGYLSLWRKPRLDVIHPAEAAVSAIKI